MTSFPELDSSPGLNAWRAMLALAVVFVMLASGGWTAVRNQRPEPGPTEAALSSWLHGSVGSRALPDPESSPGKLTAFFGTLTGEQQYRLADRYPLVVGNMGGAPVQLRYRANRTALAQASAVEKKRTHDPALSPLGHQQANARMSRFNRLQHDGRQVLAFDPEGDGRVAEVLGNLDRAQRVSVVVPGVDTDVVTFQRTHRPYSATLGMARSLYKEERAAAPHTRTTVIAWADYNSPAGIGMDAVTGKLAKDGAVRLRALTRALPGRSSVSLFCHSYGSVVCGVAAHDLPSRVTDIAVAGSPGMRVERASQLGTKARVWAMRDADDWIQDVPYLEVGGLGHGADPVSGSFGSRRLSAQDSVGHTGYFVPGTTSLANFAALGTGRYSALTCASANPGCTTGIYGAEEV